MRDPHDNHTIDLVEQAKRPLTAAERQKRHREKKKREREEGRRVVMEFTAKELMILAAVTGADAQKAEEKAPGSWWDRSHHSLWRRLVVAQTGQYTQGDARWSREALEADAAEVRAALEQLLSGFQPAAAVARADPTGEGERDYRLTEHQVALLLVCIDSHLTIRSDLDSSASPDFRELVDTLTRGSRFEGGVETMGKSQGILAILKRLEDEAKRGWKAYNEEREHQRKRGEKAETIAAQRRDAELGPLQRELEALQRERDLLEAERCQAFAANRVYEQRLRDAGLSTEYR